MHPSSCSNSGGYLRVPLLHLPEQHIYPQFSYLPSSSPVGSLVFCWLQLVHLGNALQAYLMGPVLQFRALCVGVLLSAELIATQGPESESS